MHCDRMSAGGSSTKVSLVLLGREVRAALGGVSMVGSRRFLFKRIGKVEDYFL